VVGTFPLWQAAIVWGDGKITHREVIPLETTRSWETRDYHWSVNAPGWTWARLEVWDVAGDGAFTQPAWR
jgi:hypothetical protein